MTFLSLVGLCSVPDLVRPWWDDLQDLSWFAAIVGWTHVRWVLMLLLFAVAVWKMTKRNYEMHERDWAEIVSLRVELKNAGADPKQLIVNRLLRHRVTANHSAGSALLLLRNHLATTGIHRSEFDNYIRYQTGEALLDVPGQASNVDVYLATDVVKNDHVTRRFVAGPRLVEICELVEHRLSTDGASGD